jgi:hypothetical protein
MLRTVLAAASNLFDLIQSRNLMLYPDAAMRLVISRTVAVESGLGWRIAKEKASHKIDVIVALAQAALGAAKQSGTPRYVTIVSGLWDGKITRHRDAFRFGRTEIAQRFTIRLPPAPKKVGSPMRDE